MDWFWSLDPKLAAAIVAAAVTILFNGITALIRYRKFKNDTALFEKSGKIARSLLMDSTQTYVTFSLLSHFIGGYAPNEVRKILLRVGAIRLKDTNGVEVWAMYNRIPKTDKANLRNFIAPAVDDLPQSRLFTYTADDNDG